MTTSFLHLPFELQSHILTSAFTTALDLDLDASTVRAYSSVPTSHPSTKSHSISTLSPMHQCTHTYALFTQLLPLTLPRCSAPANAITDPIGSTAEAAASDSDSEGEWSNEDDDALNLISPNQLIHCLRAVRKALHRDAEATKAQMREIVLRHPWASVAGEAYCSLWRRKERAVRVGEVVGAALAVIEGMGNEGAVGSEKRVNVEVVELEVVEMKEEGEEDEEGKGERVMEEEKGIYEGFLVGEMVARCYE